MSGWRIEPFDSVLADVSGGNAKTPASEFQQAGKFPVVDQGKGLIAGYVDDSSRLCNADLPVIVFGDHTRNFKYVDFPFCIGADGVKVIRPKGGLNVKYLYHYLKQLPLTVGGYDRHFKYLKRSSVLVPPLPEQKRIAAILDKADALRAKRRAALAQLDALTQSIFLEMFGDPVTNPFRWSEDRSLGEAAEIVSGVTKGRSLKGKQTRVVPYLTVANVQDGSLNLTNIKSIEATDQEFDRLRLRRDDLLLTEGGDPDKLGRGTLWNDEVSDCIHQNHVFRVRVTTPELLPLFLVRLIGSQRGKRYFLKSAKQTTGIASINMSQLRAFPLFVPPIETQVEFARRIHASEVLAARLRESLAGCDTLFASLQHRAFRGEL